MRLIPDDLFVAVCGYLASRPYREVAVALAALQKCPEIGAPPQQPADSPDAKDQ